MIKRLIPLIALLVLSSFDANCQSCLPLGDLPYFGIFSTTKRIVEINGYKLDKDHRVILSDPDSKWVLDTTRSYKIIEKDAYGNWTKRLVDSLDIETRVIKYEGDPLPERFFVIENYNYYGYDDDDENITETTAVKTLRDCIISKNYEELACYLQFPIVIERTQPLGPVAISKVEFLKNAEDIFSCIEENDLEFDSWLSARGWTIIDGFWGHFTFDGKFNLEGCGTYPHKNDEQELREIMERENFGLHPSLHGAQSIEFKGISDEHIIYIMHEGGDSYCLAMWAKGQSPSDEPKLVLHNGTISGYWGEKLFICHTFLHDDQEWELEDWDYMTDDKMLTVRDKQKNFIREELFHPYDE